MKGETLTISKVREGYRLTYIKPCVTDKSRKMAEVMLGLGSPVDPEFMFSRLKAIYPDLGCSKELGLARIKNDGMTLMVFSNGRIIVREAKSEADILRHVTEIANALRN